MKQEGAEREERRVGQVRRRAGVRGEMWGER